MATYLSEEKIKTLEKKARDIRETIIRMLVSAGSGHTAGPLGMTDVFTTLYFHTLNHNPENPDWKDRDRLVLSNGHIVPVQYATMAHAGYFPIEECLTLRKFSSRLQGHPEREKLPGLETTSGPLGSGLSQASGMAYGAKMDGKKFRVYCLMSDAEQQAGNIWEAAMFAGANKLGNLIGIIDRNNIQINGMTEDIMPLEPLRKKYEAFGWHIIDVDGHNMEEIADACEKARAIYEKPTLIIAHTIPGKGIPEIEFDFTWHGKPPNSKEAEAFIKDIRSMRGAVSCGDTD
ncbi:transketolase [Candidatus Kaiserbacteria bacterium CG10_big_fil_rev_8_21_14_0_10_45_20]|uniref:Transketolase n=1 Tax=Candidatus Kaiserbacteria bacterium CG10_big_fil_rev_8_21_14_0_10_45_20 TaxID=1974607 RepID=A0A2H0UGL4_9BACT|nr:MAG: transketolase [Candidatus Kaiserbacteria bacterium CG10_big_fil_rev_8_21_14_0_10_45_20]